MRTINDIYNQCTTEERPMLSTFNADWWADYVTDYAKYDKVFRRLYFSFYYFMQSSTETAAQVAENFTEDVENILMVHAEEFAQLFRVQDQALDAYGLTDNYDMKETLSRTTGETLGQRQDSYSASNGAQTNSTTGKVAPYDSETFYNDNSVQTSIGARSDSGTETKGSQTNSGTESHTLTRKGNIGVSTATDMMKKHVDFWESFNFYHYVFSIIAKELLTVG